MLTLRFNGGYFNTDEQSYFNARAHASTQAHARFAAQPNVCIVQVSKTKVSRFSLWESRAVRGVKSHTDILLVQQRAVTKVIVRQSVDEWRPLKEHVVAAEWMVAVHWLKRKWV